MKDKAVFEKPYIIEKEYTLEDLLMTDDPREKADCDDYVGKYVLRRMRHGQRRLAKSKLFRIQAKLSDLKKKKDKSDEESEDDIEDDLSFAADLNTWQDEILVHSIIECPFGVQGKKGWGKQLNKVKEFVFAMPEKMGDELLDISVELNEMTAAERKN